MVVPQPPCSAETNGRSPLRGANLLLLALLATLVSACAGAPAAPASEAYTPPPPPEKDSIGYFLANYDKSLRLWNELELAASNPRDQRTLRSLDSSLRERAKLRKAELVDVLESGAPSNREVAAVALGFSGDPSVLSPLLSALSDTSTAVVQKALLGLGILGDPATPLGEVTFLLARSPDPWTRNNAAFALQRIIALGGRDSEAAPTARESLFDEEPGVRAQCASVLGLLADPDSVSDLGGLLLDDTNLVSQAATVALVRIAEEHLEHKGEVARLLVEALSRVERNRKGPILVELTRLAGRNLGEDPAAWREWAYRMP